MAEHDTLILSDIREEANRLAEAAVTLGLSARLIGGLAIWLRCPSVREGPFARSYDDMDFAISAAAATKFKALLMTQVTCRISSSTVCTARRGCITESLRDDGRSTWSSTSW